MTTPTTADPRAFAFPGGPMGCLAVHGFTGSTAEMRPLGEYLTARGVAVRAPLLPGHGTLPEELNRVAWQDWVAAAEADLQRLREGCRTVFVAGLSLGALICCELAARHMGELAGMILYAPALRQANPLLPLAPLLRHVVRQWPAGDDEDLSDPEARERLWHYHTWPVAGAAQLLALQRRVRAELRSLAPPAIVFNSTQDGALHPSSARLLFERLGSTDKELVTLHHSGHCMLVDIEREAILARTMGFIQAHTPAQSGV